MSRLFDIRNVPKCGTALAAVWLLPASTALACPMCKMALDVDDPQPRAYMISILFMLGMIGSVTSGVGGLLCWVSRAERRALESAGYGHVLHNGVSEQGRSDTNSPDTQPPR